MNYLKILILTLFISLTLYTQKGFATMFNNQLQTYIEYYETLTPETVSDMRTLTVADVHFKDPFNDVNTIEDYEQSLYHMFKNAPDSKFDVIGYAWDAKNDKQAYLLWTYTGTTSNGKNSWPIRGMSEIRYNDDGLIVEHLDHWDSGEQFYAKLPIIGPIVKWIRGRV